MLTAGRIVELFHALNDELSARGVKGEVGICGGAVMCLVFRAREATKDVDAIFSPTREIREASQTVAARMGLPEDWLNDVAKAYFLRSPPVQEVLELSHLRVWTPRAEYMLAMKCVSARLDSHDLGDVRFLLEHLGIKAPDVALRIIEEYYPRKVIPPKTQFMLEELLEGG